MELKVLLMFTCYFYVQATSIKLLELMAPSHAAEGSEALLSCQFDVEDDVLYSIRWYKDENEFFRYVPRESKPMQTFALAGVSVDVTRSSSNVVTLVGLTSKSAGLYRCEVSGESPSFATVHEQKYINVLLLPESPPQIDELQDRYRIGDRAVLNCSSSASRPEALLKWWMNDKPVPRSLLQGPWYRVSVARPDAVETVLQLRFEVMEELFVDGVMKIKCQSVIAPLYQEETLYKIFHDPGIIQPEEGIFIEKPLVSLDQIEDAMQEELHESAIMELDMSSSNCNIPLDLFILFLSIVLCLF